MTSIRRFPPQVSLLFATHCVLHAASGAAASGVAFDRAQHAKPTKHLRKE